MAQNGRSSYADMLSAGLVICAATARVLGQYGILIVPLGLVHTVICIGLCIGWGISVNRRIVQGTVRKCMLGVSAMAVFWFVTRSVKYYFTIDPVVIRFMWYAYYAPILFIPFLVVLAAISLGKPDHYRLRKWSWLLLLPTALSMAVMTNDLHQLVFVFPEGQAWTDDHYGYGIVYYLIWGCQLACTFAAFVIMLAKCRMARKKQYLPAALILLASLYSILYVTMGDQAVFKLLAGDMTMIFSLLIIGILESAIRCGLIQTNSGYAELFAVATVGAQIVDSGEQVRYTSANAPRLTKEALREAYGGTFSLNKNTVLKGRPMPGGHVIWQEDRTALVAVLEKME